MSFIPSPQPNFNNFQTIDVQNLELKFNNLVNSINATLDTVLTTQGGATVINPSKVAFANFGGATADEITGGMISNALLKGVQDFTFQTADGSPAFSATDYNTVAWQAFTLKFSDGTQYSIDAGNTGNVSTSVVTYVYWDKAISLSVLQTTVDFTATVGQDRKLCCVVWGTADTSQKAGFVPAVGVFGANSVNILANSISAASIQAGAVTAAKIDVAQLSAISANMGTLTAGSIVIGTTNKIWLNDSADGALNIGGSTKASAPFQVTAAGVLTASSASIKTSTSGATATLGANVGGSNSGINFTSANLNFSASMAVEETAARITFGGETFINNTNDKININAFSDVYFTCPIHTDDIIVSTKATGTAPVQVTSTTVCTNLNADLLDGNHASAFASASSVANASNWDTAYTDRMKWDGGSSGLTAATGRTSLGLGSLATVNVGQTGSFPDGNMNAITVVDGIITAGL